MKTTMLNPVSPRREGEIALAPRLATVEGRLIGLLHNGKHGGEDLLFGVRDALLERAGSARFEYRRKPHAAAPASFLPELYERWEAAIVALGDCGSCSSWSVHDSIELEKAGIPCVLIVSRPFLEMNRIEAKRLLMPSLTMLVVEHPLAQLPSAQLQQKGAALIDQVLAGLTARRAGEPERARVGDLASVGA
ncbi:MAG: hypothetical protein AB7G13_30965 [Lautropia sp.]